jgi:hypothetical protein
MLNVSINGYFIKYYNKTLRFKVVNKCTILIISLCLRGLFREQNESNCICQKLMFMMKFE